MISRYLRTRERDGEVVVFHELHPDPLYFSKLEWQNFPVNGSDQLLDALKSRKLLVDGPAADDTEYEAVSARLLRKYNNASTLYLMTAQGCNLKCTYCFVPELARLYGDSRLTSDDACAGIDLWFEHLKDSYDPKVPYYVIFYGGEPLLNTDVIKKSLVNIKQMRSQTGIPKELHAMIVTNGILVDDPTVALCKENEIMVVVSVDGSRQVHDSMRVDGTGLGSYEAAIKAIRDLVASGVKTFGSVTIGPHNIDCLGEAARVLESLGVTRFGFNFIKGKRLIELVGKDGVQEYCKNAAKAVLNLGRSCSGSEYQIEKKRDAFERQDFFPHDCTCYGSQLVIQPDGQISNCPFFKARLGQVRKVSKDFRIWNQSIVREWRQRLPLYNPHFKINDAKALCGAGCAWSSQELYGNLLAPDESGKVFSEEVFNELIWSKRR